jgi:hypothetical protein
MSQYYKPNHIIHAAPKTLEELAIVTDNTEKAVGESFLFPHKTVYIKSSIKDYEVPKVFDILIGFVAKEDINFIMTINGIQIHHAMKAGTFHLALDNKSVLPMEALPLQMALIHHTNSKSIVCVGALIGSPDIRIGIAHRPIYLEGTEHDYLVHNGTFKTIEKHISRAFIY